LEYSAKSVGRLQLPQIDKSEMKDWYTGKTILGV
jgi:hypothetical protein